MTDMTQMGAVRSRKAQGLLNPASIAVIGASDQPGNLGGRIIGYLQKFGFSGPIWPVNPGRPSVAGLVCYPTPADLPKIPDLAVITIAASASVAALKDCISAGIRHGIVLAGGFAETGAAGRALQEQLTDLCEKSSFSLCGPNTLGIVNAWAPMTATFGSQLMRLETLKRGDVAIVSQSGGTAAVLHALADRAGFGIGYLISAGNEAVLSISDYLLMVADDPNIRIMAIYLEGTRDGNSFLQALLTVREAGKVVVMLKGGNAEVSARAAAAHTGSLAGEARVWDAVLQEFGVIRVSTLLEMLDTMLWLSARGPTPLEPGRRVAVVSAGEGSRDVTNDLCIRESLEPVLELAAPEVADLVDALSSLGRRDDLDAIILDAAFLDAVDAGGISAVVESVAAFRSASTKPLFASLPFLSDFSERLAAGGVYAFPDTARAVETSGRILRSAPSSWRTVDPASPAPFDWILALGVRSSGAVICEHECHALLADAGLPVAKGEVATLGEEASRYADHVGFPLVMKGLSPAVTHRNKVGLVALDIASREEAAATFDCFLSIADRLGFKLDGVYVQHQEAKGVEIIVSALRDPIFGVMVTCGAGGVATEELNDVALHRAPFGVNTAVELLRKTRVVANALASNPALDLQLLAQFIASFSQLAASAPWKNFVLEVNPVIWRPDAVVAVDGLLVIEDATVESASGGKPFP